MATVKYNGITYTCTKAIRGADYVRLLDADGCLVASFEGVSNFNAFTRSGCSWTYAAACDDCYAAVVREDGTVDKSERKLADLAVGLPVGNGNEVFNAYANNTVGDGIEYAHAEGVLTGVYGSYAYAGGKRATAVGSGSRASGFGTAIPSADAIASVNAAIAAWVANKNFLMAYGTRSFVHGDNCLATGSNSTAIGTKCRASGNYDLVVGDCCESYGKSAVALGRYNIAHGFGSVTLGNTNTTYGHSSFAAGYKSRAGTCGMSIIAIRGNIVDLNRGIDEPLPAEVKVGAECMVCYTYISPSGGTYSGERLVTVTSVVDNCTIKVSDTLIEESGADVTSGYFILTKAPNIGEPILTYGDVAIGYEAVAFGGYSVAFNNSKAYGLGSVAFGVECVAAGWGSVAGGLRTKAPYPYMSVFGIEGAPKLSDLFVVGNGTRNAFRVNMDGNAYINGKYNTTGADYAEYYEWHDGNVDAEDRRGCFVTLDGSKIRKATSEDDYILGIVSACPAVVGNSYDESWHKKYLTDVFGSIITEEVYVPAETKIVTEVVDVIEHVATNEDGTEEVSFEEVLEEREVVVCPAHTLTKPVLNPAYDPDAEYVSRQERKEWSAVGTHGQLIVIDDGSCKVNGYCKVADDGTATASNVKTLFRVAERIDDTHIKVILK